MKEQPYDKEDFQAWYRYYRNKKEYKDLTERQFFEAFEKACQEMNESIV